MERLEELLEETPCCPFGRRSRHETPARQPVAEARFNMSPTFSTGRDIFFFFLTYIFSPLKSNEV